MLLHLVYSSNRCNNILYYRTEVVILKVCLVFLFADAIQRDICTFGVDTRRKEFVPFWHMIYEVQVHIEVVTFPSSIPIYTKDFIDRIRHMIQLVPHNACYLSIIGAAWLPSICKGVVEASVMYVMYHVFIFLHLTIFLSSFTLRIIGNLGTWMSHIFI